MLPKPEFNPGNLVYIPDDPLALTPVPEFIYHDSDPVTLKNPMKFEAEFTGTIDMSLFKELTGELSHSEPQPFCMEYESTYTEQIRKHKKKRINKKWAKRYGYRDVPYKYRMENCYIHPEPFNDFSIISDPPKLVKGD